MAQWEQDLGTKVDPADWRRHSNCCYGGTWFQHVLPVPTWLLVIAVSVGVVIVGMFCIPGGPACDGWGFGPECLVCCIPCFILTPKRRLNWPCYIAPSRAYLLFSIKWQPT